MKKPPLSLQKIALAALLVFPGVVLAQPQEPPTTFSGLVGMIVDLINLAIPLLFGVVFVYLVWKMFDSWVLHAGDEGKRAEGRQYALTAVIVVVLMISAWGVVLMIRQSLLGI